MDKDNDILMQNIDDRIDAYIRGMMSEEEEAVFKKEIQADPEFRSHVLATISLIKGIRNQEASKMETIINNNAKHKTRSLLWWACSIAAMFVIVFGVRKELRYRELSGIVAPYYTEYDMSDYTRGDLDSVTVSHLYTLFNNIKEQRNVSDAIAELEPIYQFLDSDFTYNAFANDISWNLALAYVKDDQTDKAVAVLQKLNTDNPDTPISQKAQELLKRIQEL